MSPDYLPLQRSLCLLRRLLIGPVDRETLAAYVEDECDPTAYGDLTSKAAAKRLENDLQRLRDWGVDLRYADGDYQVVSLGDFSPVALPDDGLITLAFLQETFAPGAPQAEAVQALIGRMSDWLPPTTRLPRRVAAPEPLRQHEPYTDEPRNDEPGPTARLFSPGRVHPGRVAPRPAPRPALVSAPGRDLRRPGRPGRPAHCDQHRHDRPVRQR